MDKKLQRIRSNASSLNARTIGIKRAYKEDDRVTLMGLVRVAQLEAAILSRLLDELETTLRAENS